MATKSKKVKLTADVAADCLRLTQCCQKVWVKNHTVIAENAPLLCVINHTFWQHL